MTRLSPARAAGLDGCAVCDHDRAFPPEWFRAAEELEPEFLLIPGIEVSTECGHLLGWFVTEPVGTRVFRDAAARIHAQGGLAVLAHPFEHRTRAAELEAILPLLDGVEVWNSRAERKNPRANAQAAELARAHGLRGFAGSDAHVPREIGNAVTVVDARETTRDAVREALRAGALDTSGRRSLAIDTARSQWTRRRKMNADAVSYCKWALFAVKCLLEDASGRSRRRRT